MSIKTRQLEPEWMDEPDIAPEDHAGALQALERINTISGSVGIVWAPIQELAKRNPGKTIRVLDVGCGAADIPIAVVRRAREAGLSIQVDGCDFHPHSVAYATRRCASQGLGIRIFQLDVVKDEIPEGYDVIMCSLFLHHLSEPDATVFLSKAGKAAGALVLVNDLERCRRGLVGAYLATMVLFSPVARKDGPASVRAAFTGLELEQLARMAGLERVKVQRRWPFRILLSWWRLDAEAGAGLAPQMTRAKA